MPFIMAQLAVWMGYRQLYTVGVEQQGRGHVFDPAGSDLFFVRSPTVRDVWARLKDIYEVAGVSVRDCTPDGLLNDILGYEPLEAVLGIS